MYRAFFKLSRKPFDLVPDPEFIYLSASHKKALTYLDYGIRERVGFILLTGEVGSGKTTLIRNLIQRNYERVVLAKVFNTKVTSEQLLALINDDFGLPVQGKDKVSLIRDLNEFLLEQYAAGNQPMLIIDEAQNLGADLLEELRMLSNLESSQNKLLQIILVGQPELRETLSTPALLQLRQRISVNCHLQALSREELARYIEHRMAVAGNASALSFDADTLDLLHGSSRGIPRLINIFCDFLMLSAFAEGSSMVTASMAKDVIRELDFESHFWAESATPPATGVPAESGAEGDRLLTGLARRLDALERDGSQQVQAALAGISQSIESLKGELLAQVGRQEGRVSELQGRVEQLAEALDGLAAGKAPRPAPTGLARLVAGLTGCLGHK